MTDDWSPEDLERLASRLAMLISEDGEAENAGRAVGQLSRRLGLTGGQLKAIFLAGIQAADGSAPLRPDAFDRESVASAQSEIEELRGLLDRSDGERRRLAGRVAALEGDNEALREAADRARVTGRIMRVAGVVIVLAGLLGGGLAWVRPTLRMHNDTSPKAGPFQRLATAGPSGTTLFLQPEVTSPVTGRLPARSPLPVRRLLWRGFTQWVETQAGGQVAYAPATEVDLR